MHRHLTLHKKLDHLSRVYKHGIVRNKSWADVFALDSLALSGLGLGGLGLLIIAPNFVRKLKIYTFFLHNVKIDDNT